MFIGHFAVGLGAKAAAPKASLGSLFLAAQFLDLLWPTLLLFGVEHVEIVPGITKLTPLDFVHYPITHSLLMACVWGLLFFGIYKITSKDTRIAIIMGLCVVSHWVLDLVVHRPDLPLTLSGDARLGWGLWNMPAATFLIEGLLYVAGIYLYLKTTHAKNKAGVYGFWGMTGFLALIYVANVFGPPPPNEMAIAWAGQLQWIFVIMAYWVDRNRTAVTV